MSNEVGKNIVNGVVDSFLDKLPLLEPAVTVSEKSSNKVGKNIVNRVVDGLLEELPLLEPTPNEFTGNKRKWATISDLWI